MNAATPSRRAPPACRHAATGASSNFIPAAIAAFLLALAAEEANADAVIDWNSRAGEILVEARMGRPPAFRAMAIVQSAVHAAVAEAAARHPAAAPRPGHAPPASVDAAVAAANRATLVRLVPSQQAAIDAAYRSAMAQIADGAPKAEGVVIGERAAAAVLALRAADGAVAVDDYRPQASAGAWVPTTAPAVLHWPRRTPWLMANAAEFRPGPPPALGGAAWARDYDEVKALGGRDSVARTAEQAQIARFWEFSLPPIYFGIVRSVAATPGRDVARNARLYAAAAQAMDDALIAVFDAKYHYNFWRPVTAIRNGDRDGNDATERDASWTPLIDTPLHPEYPSAHGALAGAIAGVLRAELGAGPVPVLATASPTARGAVRHWTSLDELIREVGDARVCEGVHFRTSTEVGAAMGRRVGELTAQAFLQASPEPIAQKQRLEGTPRAFCFVDGRPKSRRSGGGPGGRRSPPHLAGERPAKPCHPRNG